MYSPVRRGLMDEIDWNDRLIGIKGSRGVGKTTFLLDYAREHFGADNKECLYINYFVKGNYLRAVNSTDNSPVWEDSCVEFFVQIPGEKYYYNFEFNCIGTALAARRTGREDAEHFSADKMAKIKRYSSVGNKPFCEMEGLFSWNLLVAIPFELIGLDGGQLPESLSANFYKCADGSSLPHYLSWSPIPIEKPDFHRPDYFGELRFR